MNEERTEEKELLARIADERKRQWLLRPVVLIAAFEFLGFALALGVEFAALPPEKAHPLCFWAWAASCAASLLVAAAFLLSRKPKELDAALKLDSSANAKNRLESFLELKSGGNPLRRDQAAETASFYAKTAKTRWGVLVGLLLAATLLFLNGQGAIVVLEKRALEASLEKKDALLKKEKERKEAERKKSEDFATLELTAPEPETRAKPVDEITYQAAGSSNAGFSALSLEIAINGEPKASLAVENAPLGEAGSISLEGAFCLDELKAEPFDLVAYHLKGVSKIGDDPKAETLSQPQFIQVRPFREDAALRAAFPGFDKMQSQIDLVMRFMREQIALNKGLYLARASGLQPDDKTLLNQVALMARDQRELAEDLSDALAKANPKFMTPNMRSCVDQATLRMREAAAKLDAGPAELPEAGKAQQKAIAELIASLKEMQKVVLMMMAKGAGGRPNPPQVEDPFKDKQKYQIPKMPPEENMENMLSDALKEEDAVAAKLEKLAAEEKKASQRTESKDSSMKELSARQAKISERLDALSGRQEASKDVAETVAQAARRSGAAEEAMKSAEARDALAAASKAKAAIKESLEAVRQESERSSGDALSFAQKKLNDAERQLAGGDGKGAAKELDEAAERIEKEALKQHRAGRQSQAQDMAELAKKIDEASPAKGLRAGSLDSKSAAKEIAAAKAGVEAVKDRQGGSQARLDDAIKRMERSAKELEYATQSKTLGKEERKEMLRDAELAMQDAARAADGGAKAQAPGGAANGAKPDAEKSSGRGSSRSDALAKTVVVFKPHFDNALAYPDPESVKQALAGLKTTLELAKAEAEASRTKEKLRGFNSDEVPKAYREDVSEYFKRLSEGAGR